jgi:mercuric ion transport protein
MTAKDTISNADHSVENRKKVGLLGSVALVSGLGAIAASSCCLVPLGLAAAGASAGVFSSFEALAEYKTLILGFSAVFLVGGWASWWHKRSTDCCSTSDCSTTDRNKTNAVLLSISSVVIATAFVWDRIEPLLLKAFRGHL